MTPDARRVAALTAELVALPTDEREEEAQKLLRAWLEHAGFDCELREVLPGRPNLLARRGTGGPFLCSHVDVHPPHAHPDPWTVREEDGCLVGRGVLDAKGQIAALVAACEAVPDAPARLLVTCDEEGGGKGSELVDLSFLGPPEHGVVLEPTGFRLGVAQPGGLDVRLCALGVAAHAYATSGGVSALDMVLGAVDALGDCRFLAATHPLLPAPRRVVGRLHAGEHLWRIPGRAEAEVALEVLPGTAHDAAREEAEGILSALAGGWRSAGAELTWEVLDASEAIEVSADLPVVKALRSAAGEELPLAGMSSWTDAGNLLVHHGVPCVVFGAGDLLTAHSDHERVPLQELTRLAVILARLLDQSRNSSATTE